MILLATRHGLVICQQSSSGDWEVLHRALKDFSVTSLIAREGVILAGTTDGVYRSVDHGRTWHEASRGITARHVRWMAYHPDVSNFELCATEPAGIFISRDGGDFWRECLEVTKMRHRFGWYLPYSPEAGCVRGFSYHHDRCYAAVEVGGVLVSQDGGQTWALVKGSTGEPDTSPPSYIHADVHSIAVHPSSQDWVFAPTGGGFYRSMDGGTSWELLYRCYCRAVWVDPADRDHIILGPADGVDHHGRIEQSSDGGRTWESASSGLGTPWSHYMVERFTQAGRDLFAVLSNGELLAALLPSLNWRKILPEVADIAAVGELYAHESSKGGGKR